MVGTYIAGSLYPKKSEFPFVTYGADSTVFLNRCVRFLCGVSAYIFWDSVCVFYGFYAEIQLTYFGTVCVYSMVSVVGQ